MPRSTRSTLALATLAVAVPVLAGCTAADVAGPTQGSDPSPRHSATSAAAAPTDAASPEPSPAAQEAAPDAAPVLPATCAEAIPEDYRAATYGGLEVETVPTADVADAVLPSQVPVLAGESLACSWYAATGADLGALLQVSRVTEDEADAYLDDLSVNGWDCGPALGGDRCDYAHTAQVEVEGDVDGLMTVVARDGVLLTVTEFGTLTGDFAQTVVQHVWR